MESLCLDLVHRFGLSPAISILRSIENWFCWLRLIHVQVGKKNISYSLLATLKYRGSRVLPLDHGGTDPLVVGHRKETLFFFLLPTSTSDLVNSNFLVLVRQERAQRFPSILFLRKEYFIFSFVGLSWNRSHLLTVTILCLLFALPIVYAWFTSLYQGLLVLRCMLEIHSGSST